MDKKPSLGLIGLGIMGRPMARNLLKAGYRLTVNDIDVSAVAAPVAEGAVAGATPAQVAASTDVLITMLPDSPQVREVYLGRAARETTAMLATESVTRISRGGRR